MKTSRSQRRKKKFGFTILELFVIMALLGVSLSLLVPALSRTKPSSKAFQCLNHLRQLAGAVSLYTQDNHELFPPNPDDGSNIPGYAWCLGNVSISGGADQFDPDLIADPKRMLLASYTGTNVDLFNCPADPRVGLYDGGALYPNSPLKGQRVRAARSISMSQAVGTIDPCYAGSGGHCGIPNIPVKGPWLTGSYGANNGTYATFGKSGTFQGTKPEQIILIVDEAIYSINDSSLATCANVANPVFIDFPASRHARGATISFCDGHSELHKWEGSAILAESQSQWSASHFVRSAGDKADFTWLATHSSVRIK